MAFAWRNLCIWAVAAAAAVPAQSAQTGTAGAKVAAQSEPAATKWALPVVGAGECDNPDANEVLVCGEPADAKYRIDPAVLAVEGALEPADGRAENRDAATAEACPPHGIAPCQGQGTVPVSAIALVAARTAILAIKGEDWREPLRTSPDQYRLYQQAKRREERRKPRVTVGVGASDK